MHTVESIIREFGDPGQDEGERFSSVVLARSVCPVGDDVVGCVVSIPRPFLAKGVAYPAVPRGFSVSVVVRGAWR